MISDVLVACLLWAGAGWTLVAAIGTLRMPDTLTRMHPATKAATLGLGCLVCAVAIHFAEVGVATRALLIGLFVFLTAPVAAHRIGRVAFLDATRATRAAATSPGADAAAPAPEPPEETSR